MRIPLALLLLALLTPLTPLVPPAPLAPRAAAVLHAQRIDRSPFARYEPSGGALARDSAPRGVRADSAFRPRLDPAAWIGSSIGSGAGLLGGYALGDALADHFDVRCCGDDPGLHVALLGAAAGSVVGSALGGTVGARVAGGGRPRASFGRRMAAAIAGTLAGALAVQLADQATELERTPALVVYSISSGLLAALVSVPSSER